MYSPPSTFAIGMYAFCNLVPVVVEAWHVHMMLLFLMLPICWLWETGILLTITNLRSGHWFALEPSQHFRNAVNLWLAGFDIMRTQSQLVRWKEARGRTRR